MSLTDLMNIFTKNRLVFWLLIILVLINISALVSFYYFTRKPAVQAECCSAGDRSQRALTMELGLTPDQGSEVERILSRYREDTRFLADELMKTRRMMLGELSAEHPDTAQIHLRIKEITTLQGEIQLKNVRQYLDLKAVCTPDQAQRLSNLYHELYGCPMKENRNRMRHQYRHGQGGDSSGF